MGGFEAMRYPEGNTSQRSRRRVGQRRGPLVSPAGEGHLGARAQAVRPSGVLRELRVGVGPANQRREGRVLFERLARRRSTAEAVDPRGLVRALPRHARAVTA
jgi:hypothetical protein